MGNGTYISDDGVVQKTKWGDRVIIGICLLVSIGLVYLGFMAYFVG